MFLPEFVSKVLLEKDPDVRLNNLLDIIKAYPDDAYIFKKNVCGALKQQLPDLSYERFNEYADAIRSYCEGSFVDFVDNLYKFKNKEIDAVSIVNNLKQIISNNVDDFVSVQALHFLVSSKLIDNQEAVNLLSQLDLPTINQKNPNASLVIIDVLNMINTNAG